MASIDDRIRVLEQKLARRKGKPGYAKNCEDLEAEIARLKQASGQ